MSRLNPGVIFILFGLGLAAAFFFGSFSNFTPGEVCVQPDIVELILKEDGLQIRLCFYKGRELICEDIKSCLKCHCPLEES